VKVFAFVDTHALNALMQLSKKIAKADIVICAGDFTWFGKDKHKALAVMESWKKPVYIIHGNHEGEEALAQSVMKYNNIVFAHGKQIDINGVQFLFWGGGGFAQHDMELLRAYPVWKAAHKNPSIFVTHGPPFNTHLDDLGGHVGSVTIRFIIDQLQPTFHFCGHIHETSGVQDKIGKTTTMNVGPAGFMVEF
jgi:uncharacterized protein